MMSNLIKSKMFIKSIILRDDIEPQEFEVFPLNIT